MSLSVPVLNDIVFSELKELKENMRTISNLQRENMQNSHKKRWSNAEVHVNVQKTRNSVSCLLKKYGNDGYCRKKS